MNDRIAALKNGRLFLLNIISELTTDQLNKIPEGFSNNIAWNLGHIIAAQQGLCYIRSGNKTAVDDTFFLQYKPGSKPEHFISSDEIAAIKALMISSLEQFEADAAKNLFANYTAFTNRYGTALNNIDDALNFVSFHEGLHSGVVTVLKKLV